MPVINKIHGIILVFLVLFIFLWYRSEIKDKVKEKFQDGLDSLDYPGERVSSLNEPCRTCDNIQEPSYLNPSSTESDAYAQSIIERQASQIRDLRKQVNSLMDKVDDGNKYYRKKLSNKYYRPKPFMSHAYQNMMNLNDEDFSNKTLSTIKFLSQTRSSKFFGDEIHFPTELCGNYCSTSDKNAALNEQIDLVRPISPTNALGLVQK